MQVRRVLAVLPPWAALRLTGCCMVAGPSHGRYSRVFAAESGRNPDPVRIEGRPAIGLPETFDVPACGLHDLPAGYLSALSGVHRPDGRMVECLSGLTPHNRSELLAGKSALRRRPVRRAGGTTLVLATSQQWNYFHWLFEVLGRYAVAEQAGVAWDRISVENKHPFQKESLAALGIPAAGILDSAENPLVKCERILAPDCPDAFHHPAAWMVDFLRGKFGGRVSGSPLLYVSRERARFRRTTNGKEVERLLTGRGFRPVVLEEMPFSEQAALFEGARVVVATHGAALANLVFCRPGTCVVEIMPARYCHWVYYRLSCRAGLRYACVVGEGDPDPEPWAHQKEDVTVPIASLARALEAIG